MNPMSARWCRLYKGTESELSLEDAVASLGVPYRTQFPCFLYGLRYFLDFYLPTLGVVIEVDDPSHDRLEKVEADAERTAALEKEWGVRVLRCTNDEALNDPHGTVKGLMKRAGIDPSQFRANRLAEHLPQPKRAPQKARRESVSAARRSQRKARD